MSTPVATANRGRPKDPAKRAAILDAAKQLFLSGGFSGTSMDAVAKQAGVENIDFAPLRARALDDGHDLERLDTLAQTTYEQIMSGQFRSPRS